MKKYRLSNLIFIAAFIVLLVLPFALMNHKQYQTSDIDNKTLTEWPEFKMEKETIQTIEDYVDDRIGFRSAAIYLYTKASDALFDVMVHPLFMYGEEGHIYYKDQYYISAYQRLNTDEEYMDSFVDFLEKTNDYLEQKNIKFIYFLAPDKKSIYPEYFPKSIHVKEDEETVIGYMTKRLSESDIEYVIPYDELIKAKDDQVIYNKKYDATHWNEFGSYIGQKLLDEHIMNWFDDVKPLSSDDYVLTYEKRTNLDQSDFPIDDDVPVYTLITDTSQDASGYMLPYLNIDNTTFYAHYMNPEVTNGKRLLVFTDSYFAPYSKYYKNRFSEVFYVHRQNFEYVQYIVDLVFPDAVIFETAERSITGEMPFFAEFNDIYYEMPYVSALSGSDDAPTFSIISAKGVKVDGTNIYINPENGDNIVSITGVLDDYDRVKDMDVYLYVEGNYVETDYLALHKKALEEHVKYFEFNIQRRYVAPCQMQLIAVDRANKVQYTLADFTVSYK